MKKILSLLLTLILCIPIFAGTNDYIGLAFNPSPDSTVVGYIIYLNNTNKTDINNNLTYNLPVNNLLLDKTNIVFATAYNPEAIESDPSNLVKIYRPISPDNLNYILSATSANITLRWAIHTNINVNAYNIFLGTNINNLLKLTTVLGRANNSFALNPTNLVRNATNYFAVSAYNNIINSTNTVVESPLSTNATIVLPPIAPPTNLRINIIVQSSTNLLSWIDITNYDHYAIATLPNQSFRGLVQISSF